jgi:hypothetical protein
MRDLMQDGGRVAAGDRLLVSKDWALITGGLVGSSLIFAVAAAAN